MAVLAEGPGIVWRTSVASTCASVQLGVAEPEVTTSPRMTAGLMRSLIGHERPAALCQRRPELSCCARGMGPWRSTGDQVGPAACGVPPRTLEIFGWRR